MMRKRDAAIISKLASFKGKKTADPKPKLSQKLSELLGTKFNQLSGLNYEPQTFKELTGLITNLLHNMTAEFNGESTTIDIGYVSLKFFAGVAGKIWFVPTETRYVKWLNCANLSLFEMLANYLNDNLYKQLIA